MRCYTASLRGTELPNPQTLLASITKPTKLALGKLGVFSVASLHAIVSVWQYGCMSVWQYEYVAVWVYMYSAVWICT